ncbi:MAG: S41 family peptidase [Treponemataceae bacterium]|nr:S41 family peptidase [Treponemataceae bacterium]
MKASQKTSFLAKFLIVLFSVGFAFYAVFTPSLFAEQRKEKENGKSSQSYMMLINSIFNLVLNNYVDEVDPEVLYAGALKGMMESLNDPYTVYLDSSSLRGLTDTTKGEFGGVGLSITKPLVSTPEKPAYVEVMSPIEGGPGYKEGIQAGDFIISIEGTPTPEITMDEVLDKLRGQVGKKVTIEVKRGQNLVFTKTLTREVIEVPTVKHGFIDYQGAKIAYIKIIEFTPLTAEKVENAIKEFDEESYDGLIIDLRNNPGGLITSVRDVADRFIDVEGGTIVSTRVRGGELNDVLTSTKSNTVYKSGKPIVVLINKGSASASEILSGALKDYHLAYLMGERTYGKGSVQQLIPLYNNDGVKITMARYYTPSDVNIDKIGIPPDQEVKLEDFTEANEKAYAKMVEDDAIAKYVKLNNVENENDIAFAAKVLSGDYELSLRLLRRLVRMEVNRTKDPALYDLDYDIQLVEAIKVIEGGKFSSLMKNTKTLKELQDASMLQENKDTKEN